MCTDRTHCLHKTQDNLKCLLSFERSPTVVVSKMRQKYNLEQQAQGKFLSCELCRSPCLVLSCAGDGTLLACITNIPLAVIQRTR